MPLNLNSKRGIYIARGTQIPQILYFAMACFASNNNIHEQKIIRAIHSILI